MCDTIRFWIIKYDAKGKNPKLEIDENKFIRFLSKRGFSRIDYEKSFIVINCNDNIVSITPRSHTKDYVISALATIPAKLLSPFNVEDLKKVIMQRSKELFSDDLLSFIEVNKELIFLRSNRENSFIFYKNGYVTINKGGITPAHQYSNLKQVIWKSQIIQRRFIYNPSIESNLKGCEFGKFIYNVCNDDLKRVKSLMSAIGYMLHDYKDPANAKAIIFLDEGITGGVEAEGRRGKSIVGRAIGHIVKSISIDSRADVFKSFSFQLFDLDLKVAHYDDCNLNFPFDRLFSVITGDIIIEKKYLGAKIVGFSDSPKFLISTNYILHGDGASYEARKFEIEFSKYYHKGFSPADEFGHRLLDNEWPPEEWNKFDNFMMLCIKLFLKEGLIEHEPITLAIRKLIQKSNKEFVVFAIKYIRRDIKYNKKSLYAKFMEIGNSSSNSIEQNTFTRWIKEFAKYRKVNWTESRSNGKDYMILTKK